MTYIINIKKGLTNAMLDLVEKELIRGGIIIVPFDTVYGIIADPKNDTAVGAIFNFKNRPLNKTIGLAVSDIDKINGLCVLDQRSNRFIEEKTPGPFTFILKINRPQSISQLCIRKATVGVRIPDSNIIREITMRVGGIIAQTSANKSGEQNAYSISDLEKQYSKSELSIVNIILDNGRIESQGASRLFDLTGTNHNFPKEIEREK